MSRFLEAALMSVSRVPITRTVTLAAAATFSALASMITLVIPSRIQPPFPILPYLKFDPAEIVDVIAFLIFGPIVGLVTATVHFIVLTAVSGGPFGPSLKYLAVLTTYTGLIVAARVGKHSLLRTGSLMTLSGLLTRVSLMTVVNYLYWVYLAQTVFGANYEAFARFTLSKVGINLTGSELISFVLGLTGIFNAIHTVISVGVSLVIVSALLARAPHLIESRAWIRNYLTRAA